MTEAIAFVLGALTMYAVTALRNWRREVRFLEGHALSLGIARVRGESLSELRDRITACYRDIPGRRYP